MKTRYLLFILALLSLNICLAQHEWAPIGATWHYNARYNTVFDPVIYTAQVVTSVKDTLVQGKDCRLVGDYIMHQDGYQIYYLWQDTFRLIYDFDVSVGDTVQYEMLNAYDEVIDMHFLIEEVDSIYHNGYLKRVRFSELNDLNENHASTFSAEANQVYIEKIGSLHFVVINDVGEAILASQVNEWLRCYQDDLVDYKSPYFLNSPIGSEACDYTEFNSSTDDPANSPIQIFPNPIKDQLSIHFNPEYQPANHYLKIVDLVGKPIQSVVLNQFQDQIDLSHLVNGIYFIRVFNDKERIFTDRLIKQ